MENNPNAVPVAESVKPTVEPKERWLLAGALLIGISFSWMWPASIGAWSYGLFWLIALAVYLVFCGKAVWNNRYAMLLLGGTVALLVRYFFGWEDGFDVFHIVLLPMLLMLVLVFVKENPKPQQEGILLFSYLSAWFQKPFSAMGRAFSVLISLGGGRKQVVPVVVGVIIAVPCTVAVAALLMAADAGMETVITGLIGDLRFENVLGYLLRALLVTLLFYSLYHHAVFGAARPVRESGNRDWHPVIFGIAASMLLVLYGIYITVQFQYLFGARLPAEMTYSAYAREGFWQLIAVSCINFLLFGLTERYAKQTVGGTVLQALLLLATAMILSSALVRLLLYIGAYGLTMKRILPLWAMVFLAVLTLLCSIRLRKKSMPLMRIAAMILLYWYVVLAFVPWDTVIRAYNRGM